MYARLANQRDRLKDPPFLRRHDPSALLTRLRSLSNKRHIPYFAKLKAPIPKLTARIRRKVITRLIAIQGMKAIKLVRRFVKRRKRKVRARYESKQRIKNWSPTQVPQHLFVGSSKEPFLLMAHAAYSHIYSRTKAVARRRNPGNDVSSSHRLSRTRGIACRRNLDDAVYQISHAIPACRDGCVALAL